MVFRVSLVHFGFFLAHFHLYYCYCHLVFGYLGIVLGRRIRAMNGMGCRAIHGHIGILAFNLPFNHVNQANIRITSRDTVSHVKFGKIKVHLNRNQLIESVIVGRRLYKKLSTRQNI